MATKNTIDTIQLKGFLSLNTLAILIGRNIFKNDCQTFEN